jgi:isopentenyl-diphosphate delta-isomerase
MTTDFGRLAEDRKREHLQPFRDQGVPARGTTTWLEHVRLVHKALPEIDKAQIDLRTRFAERQFAAPLFITGMTGGTAEARAINRDIARVAGKMGIGFGLGSLRTMLDLPDLAETYKVRDEAPEVFLAGNIGGTQLASMSLDRLHRALEQVGADALCVHLNPAQELVQPEGDTDFRGVASAIGRTVREIGIPVIVKEVGCGLGREVGMMLRDLGVCHVDAAGVGGTSWVGLELGRGNRAEDPEPAAFWDWGIPTAAAVMELSDLDLEVIGSGGIRTGLDVARVVALGATLAGVASPVIQAWFRGGADAVEAMLEGMLEGLRVAMVLTGSRTLADLRVAPRVVTGPLFEWGTARVGGGGK